MGQSPEQGVIPKCRNGFVVSEVNSESERTRGYNLCNVVILRKEDGHSIFLSCNKRITLYRNIIFLSRFYSSVFFNAFGRMDQKCSYSIRI